MIETVNAVRKKRPLIHHITNSVVMNFTANGLLAFGASPIMAKDINEVSEMTSLADGLLINIGTLLTTERKSMLMAGKTANQKGIPLVFDPVGITTTQLRQNFSEEFLENVETTVIKGNAGEMAYLAGIPWESKGVDSVDDDLTALEEIAKVVAQKYQTIAVVTGEHDVIASQSNTFINTVNVPELTLVTGSGCLLGSLIAAGLATNQDSFQATKDIIQFYTHAAHYALTQNKPSGPGSFSPYLIDALGMNFDE